jgi:hypothetical protein
MTMEVMTVTKALSWLETQAFTNACVLSDSMSMLRKVKSWLEASRMDSITEAVEFGKYQFYFCLRPCWSKYEMNELIGLLDGCYSDGCAMDHADVLHALRETGRVEDSLGDKESRIMEKGGQVRLDAAKYDQYACSQRRIVNQIRTSAPIRHTLLNVLERRSEHLWVCPVCKDDNLSTNH